MSATPKLPKHHYIPVFYLREWTNAEGRLVEFSRPTGNEVKPRPAAPKGTGYERGLYRLSHLTGDEAEAFERIFFGQVDNRAKDAMEIVLGRQPWKWTDRSRTAWTRFLVGMFFRNPERIRATRKYIEEFSLDTFDIDEVTYNAQKKPGDPDYLEYLVRSVEFNAIEWTTSMIANSNIARHLINMRWSVRDIGGTGLTLFTSDRPIIMTNGLIYDHAHLVMPVSPTKAFVACNTVEQEKLLLGMSNMDFIRASNEQVLKYAQQYAWNTDDQMVNIANRYLGVEAEVSRGFFDAPPYRPPALVEEPAV